MNPWSAKITSTQRPILTALFIVTLALGACTERQDESQAAESETLGAVNFPISCDEKVVGTFTRGLAYLHSFEYPEALADFQAVTQQDPSCGIAHWGEAMTYLHPVWPVPMSDDRFEPGYEAAEKAQTVSAQTEREQAYIAATSAYYLQDEDQPHRYRALAWSNALRDLSEQFPEDTEAKIFYALSLLGTVDPADATLANQRQAGSLLNEMFPIQPKHPGIAHYLIHSFDYAALAEKGLPAALSYAKIAPASSHALHMPSHIFTRLGMWNESIATNMKSADAARRMAAAGSPVNLHPHGYLAYAYLQIDDQKGAKAILDEAALENKDRGGRNIAEIPARWALERRDWAAAAEVVSSGTESDNWPRAEVRALIPYARALGAARIGKVDEARIEVDKLRQLHDGLVVSPLAGHYDWTGKVESMRLAAAAWLAYAEDQTEHAIQLAQAAADLDEKVGKHPATAGSLLPPREQLGDLFFELNRPSDALMAYEQSLHFAPNRFNSLYGAARSAELSGNREKATQHYAKLVEITVEESTRPEVEQARAFLNTQEVQDASLSDNQYNNILKRSKLSKLGEEGADVLIREALFPPGWKAPKHFHNADLFIYVITGEFEVVMEKSGRNVYTDGQALEMRAGDIMNARNVSDTIPLKLAVFQVGSPDSPFVVPVE